MSHHIDESGRFQSDKFPDLAPDKIVVSFKDPRARPALVALASGYAHTDRELAEDIRIRLASIGYGDKESPPPSSSTEQFKEKPLLSCSRCGRLEYANVGDVDGMTQPGGTKCGGVFD